MDFDGSHGLMTSHYKMEQCEQSQRPLNRLELVSGLFSYKCQRSNTLNIVCFYMKLVIVKGGGERL